ncbi:DUF6702 family protein [Massilia sp. CFBP9026]|uniref:DUF6702 family protein n=1 Tax=Massilia sp. CFBP9026 TaxID=3096536 RepID=UPI002A6AC913|nr:DUF6702 family protein [Massilia sp. CFBP9026]MDY0962283.1 DUF6702 family protein [Massilia sp. CFBP9026]
MTLQGFKRLCVALLLCVSTAASAHRFHFGMTDISYNERTGSTEIVHTYTAHDIDALLLNLYQRQFDLSDPEDQDVLRQYVERQFWLAAPDGKRLPPKWIGMTVDANSVVIYQEIENTPLARAATIRQGVLIDFLPEQVNTVNLGAGGTVRSLTFTRQALEQPAQ